MLSYWKIFVGDGSIFIFLLSQVIAIFFIKLAIFFLKILILKILMSWKISIVFEVYGSL